MRLNAGRYDGLLYRALNPIYAQTPLSGDGAARYGGRFNAQGTPSLYTAMTIRTAILEINQVGTLQPTTLVAYKASLTKIFDATDQVALRDYKMTAESLADLSWRQDMREGGLSKTQRFAAGLMEDGWAGMRVPSFARGATSSDLNLVLWRWNGGQNSLVVVDDEKRLG